MDFPPVIDLLLRSRHILLAAVTLVLALLMIAGKRVDYEQSIRSFFSEDDPAIVDYNRASAAFGDDNFVFVSYADPDLLTADGIARVAELSRTLGPAKIKGVVRVESLDAMPQLWQVDDGLIQMQKLPGFLRDRALTAIRDRIKNLDMAGSGNALTIGSAIRSADAAGLEVLKKRITSHPLIVGTLIDAEAKSTALVVRLMKTEEHVVTDTVKALREKSDAFAARHKLGRPAIVGPPVLLADGFSSIEVDGRRLAVVGMILIGIVTLTATRSLWWAVVPILAGWLVWLATEWVMVSYGLKLALSGGPLVAQIIVLTMPAASHLAIHFRDERRREADRKVAARSTLRAVSLPIFWCAMTGAIGYGALVTSNVMPIRQFGWIMGSCTLLASLLVMAIAPSAMLPPFRLDLPAAFGSRSRVGAGVGWTTGWVVRRPLFIVLGIVAIVAPIALGMTRLTYESNYINAFMPETRVVQDYRAVESRLGGIGVVEMIAPVPATIDRNVLAKMEAAGDALLAESPPRPSYVLSLATVLDPDRRLAALSDEAARWVLATKLELIAASPQAELLRGFYNPDSRQARILLRLVEQQPASDKAAIFVRAIDEISKRLGKTELTGLSFLMTRTTEAVIRTQWSTFGYSVAGILLMLTIALRGPILAALALLPTLLAVGLVLGLMGWLGIKLDLGTALVASVALGLSVDDTFHCLLQFRRLRKVEGFEPSLFASYSVTGPGVILSSTAVALGFLVLYFSEFAPFSNFGVMVAVATAGSTLGNILFLPACLTLGERMRERWTRKQPAAPPVAPA
ncbi:efflux RND transporter permease subunit [Tundrisphaera sp. TA3]|uniref:efflux RND transporter permease subunit n=1 Tax=Tundrisphaera sp. TA3 TaxID=3435775 RepID=UPI003EB9E825